MSLYIIAQFIGTIGYFFYVSAPQAKNQMRVIQIEAIGCSLLCIQWFLMAQFSLLTLNILAICISLFALKAHENEKLRKAIPLVYCIAITAILSTSTGHLIDLLALTACCLNIASKTSQDHSEFRGFAIIAGSLLMCSSMLAYAVPAAIFNALFTLNHMRRFVEINTTKFPQNV